MIREELDETDRAWYDTIDIVEGFVLIAPDDRAQRSLLAHRALERLHACEDEVLVTYRAFMRRTYQQQLKHWPLMAPSQVALELLCWHVATTVERELEQDLPWTADAETGLSVLITLSDSTKLINRLQDEREQLRLRARDN